MKPNDIKAIRQKLNCSQEKFAELLGVSFATVNRWENNKGKPQRDRLERMRQLMEETVQYKAGQDQPAVAARLDFEGDAEAVKLVIDAHRLQNGHIFNKTFGLELSRVVPLPHQRIAVYEQMLARNLLRFLLADDAGAGKTIMAGLYIREMFNRGRIKQTLILCPAGLTWNWQRELRNFFELDFAVLRGSDFQHGEPLNDTKRHGFIISIDTAATDSVRGILLANKTPRFDLAIFDEAHKLAWSDPRRPDSKTRRYCLAEKVAGRINHLLLLTATPHMGKSFPYFALWRLLDAQVFSTTDALTALPAEQRQRFFLRRLKEEMITYDGKPLYMPRICQTIQYPLTTAEREFYDEVTDYLRSSYENNVRVNRSAAEMVVGVMQRRLASSTYAMLESLGRRREQLSADGDHRATISTERLREHFDTSTADDGEAGDDGREADETFDDAALGLLIPATNEPRERELTRLDQLIARGRKLLAELNESKFQKLRELIESAEFHREKLLVFTEYRDTLDYLRARFEALGYTGQIASIHGGMDVSEREAQRLFFMPSELRRELGLGDPNAPSARVLLATDAAGEGINLQFAWVMVNFDIPWNPARLEQRMGRLHRFGQKHDEVLIFNLVAGDTREGEVLQTLLEKLDEARKELCTDKVFDVVGQRLQEIPLRDLFREALLTGSTAPRQKLAAALAAQKIRADIEVQRLQASTFGDVAKRLGELKAELDTERFSRLLPAYVEHFVEKAAPRLGLNLDGDLERSARIVEVTDDGRWFHALAPHFPDGFPEWLSSCREGIKASAKVAFLRPGEVVFDALCQEVRRKYDNDVRRGAVFCDPTVDKPYFAALYRCQVGGSVPGPDGLVEEPLLERRLLGIRWDGNGEFGECPANHLLALLPAPKALLWKAGELLRHPDEQIGKADVHAQRLAESWFLNQARTIVEAETSQRLEDLMRGFDYRSGELSEQRADLGRRVREGDAAAMAKLEEIKAEQKKLEEERTTALIYEQRRREFLSMKSVERLAVALVVPDTSEEAQETYNQNIEEIAIRIARNFEVERYQARVFDVSAPHLARGYDLESHRANGEKIAIEVKGRAGRGPVQLTENEWPTAANVRERYWLYVVVDCATEPKMYRVQDPAFKLAVRSRQSFTINIGDIIKEAEQD